MEMTKHRNRQKLHVQIKRLVMGLFLILSSKMLNSASEEHVHFKIHVPEVINHQVHTKTIFIHVHKPMMGKPKKKEETPKTYYKEKHSEDWSSWNSYGYHDYEDNSGNDRDLSKNQKDYKDRNTHKSANPFIKYHRDSYMPTLQHNKPNYLKSEHENVGPPQYAVREDVKEIDHNNIEPYKHTYEEGYHRGSESETGHLYTDDLTKFYDDKFEEADQSAEAYKNDSKEKTDAGRYLVDDSEYQRNMEKYEAEKRISPRIFISS